MISSSKTANERHRLLKLIAAVPDGLTETALLKMHHFKMETLVELITGGFAEARPERIVGGGRPINVTRLCITEAGRRILGE